MLPSITKHFIYNTPPTQYAPTFKFELICQGFPFTDRQTDTQLRDFELLTRHLIRKAE
jgi:hypothetical protein